MVKKVTTLDEVRSMTVDGKLYFAKNGVIKLCIDENIIGSTF